jgi:8-oxo-dGTP pyrophosphatase MutT (NUDIX family)
VLDVVTESAVRELEEEAGVPRHSIDLESSRLLGFVPNKYSNAMDAVFLFFTELSADEIVGTEKLIGTYGVAKDWRESQGLFSVSLDTYKTSIQQMELHLGFENVHKLFSDYLDSI